jgi:hypothetical protein
VIDKQLRSCNAAIPCAWKLVPWLAGRQSRPADGRALSEGADPQIDRDLTELTYEIGGLLPQVANGAGRPR